MKSILISIKPKWTAKILNGEKTIEIRKTAPKCDLPIDVYIYCTKGGPGLWYVKNKTYQGGHAYVGDGVEPICNGKVVAKFVLNEISEYRIKDANTWNDSSFGETVKKLMGLSLKELQAYADGKPFFGWHISDLVIFDHPKDLSNFIHPYYLCHLRCYDNMMRSFCRVYCKHNINAERLGVTCDRELSELKPITRAPQSWQYVEEEK